MQILIAEDDERLAAALEKILKDNDYDVDVVHDGQEGLNYATVGRYDVIILDVMMPKMNGFEVTKEIRRAGISTPVMLLTARDATADKIVGFDSGADDYMTKPFSPAELMAHLRALTRRQGEVQFERLKAGDLDLNLESYELTCGKKSIQLSFKEFSILKILMSNPGAVVSKETLIEKAWVSHLARATTMSRPTSRSFARSFRISIRSRRSKRSVAPDIVSPRKSSFQRPHFDLKRN